MKEILIIAMKRGAGKSTIGESIRQYLRNVELVDLDPQKTLSIALDMVGIPLTPPKVEYRLYDTPPYNDEALRAIMQKVDHIIVPTKLGYPDLIAFRTVYESLLATKTIDKSILVFNEVRKPLTKEAQAIMQCYKTNYPAIKFAKTLLSRLEGFRQVFRKALYGKALSQTKDLVNEILNKT